jgi:hypothetical protein
VLDKPKPNYIADSWRLVGLAHLARISLATKTVDQSIGQPLKLDWAS